MAGKPKLLLLLDVDDTVLYPVKTTCTDELGEKVINVELHYVYGEGVWHNTLLELKRVAETSGVELIVGLVSNKPFIDEAIIKLLTEFDPAFFCAYDAQHHEIISRHPSGGFVHIVNAVTADTFLLETMVNLAGEIEETEHDHAAPISPTIILRDLGVERKGKECKSGEISQLAERLGITKKDIIFVDDKPGIVEGARKVAEIVFHMARENPQERDSLPNLVCYQENANAQIFKAEEGLAPFRKIVKDKIALICSAAHSPASPSKAGMWRSKSSSGFSESDLGLQEAGSGLTKTFSAK